MSTYDIFVIDPPWSQRKGGIRKVTPNQTRELDYKTMGTLEIFEMLDREILSRASPNHSVFLWTIDKFLRESEKLMEARGYRRHARFVWDKTNGVAPAFTVRFSHEYLIWFYSGKMIPVSKSERGKFSTVIREAHRQHSRKPDGAYAMIEALYPELRKLDVFSRENRIGWDSWGDQCGYFDEPDDRVHLAS